MAEGQLPTQIGKYKIVGELGSGGFGRVYRGYDPLVGRSVAIKILTQVSKEVLTRFHNEAMVAGNLRHENIVTVYEFGTHEDFPFLAMEYLEGEDLHHIIASRKPLTVLEKCNIMWQVAEGLYCAHRNGVVHRDVKPANIMVLRDGTVKIMDFGIARLTGDRAATRLTQQGHMIGTLLYMAPEQFSGADFDALSDIFAYGVIFYELITGRHPFEASDPRILMYKLRCEEPPPIKDFIPEFPLALQHVISKLVQNDRELRYASLKDVQFDMEPIRIELQSHRAGELLQQAQELFAKKQLEPSQALVQEVLSLEPSNRAARALWADLQKQINQRTLQPRIESLLSAGEESLTRRRFAESLQSFESALRLDRENPYIQGRIEQARRLLEHSTRASQLLAEARRQFEREKLTAAYRTISEALRQDPQNSEAAEFLKDIQSVVERREAEQRVDEAIRKAEGLLLIPAYDEAIALLTGLGPDSESPKIKRVLELARSEKVAQERKQKLHNEMAAATDLLRDHKLDEAAHWLENLHQEFPDNQEVARLLAYAQKEVAAVARSKGVESVAREASALAEARNFEESLATLERGLKKYSGEAMLIRLLGSTMAAKGAWERQQAVESAISKCEALRSQGRFAEAIEIVEATQQEYSSEPALISLLEQLEKEWAQQRRNASIRKTREQAEGLLGQKQPEEAVRLIQQALVQYSGEPALVEVMERAQNEVRALERARAVEAIGKKAVQCVEAHDFDMALRILDKGLETWPNEAVLIRSRGDILASKRAWERQEAIREIDRRARQLQTGERFDEALNLLTKSLLDYPDEDSLIQLRKQVEEGRQAYDRRQAILRIASEARLLISRDNQDEAVAMLNEAMQKYPGEPVLERLATQARDALRARERALAIARTIQQSQGFVAAKEFDRATQMLEQGLGRYAGDGELIRELESVKEAESAWRREQAINALVARATLLADEKRYDDALKLLEAPGLQSPALTEARKRIEGQRQEHLRREAIGQAANEARGMLDRGRLEEAMQLLQKAAAKYPEAPEWAPLLTRAQQELAARKRAEAIAKLLRDARSLADQRNYPGALEALSRGLKTFPGNSELESLHTSIEADQAAWKREQAIQRVVAEAEKLATQSQFEKASGLVATALEEFKNAPALLDLRRRLERELALQKRAEAIVQAGAQAKALIAAGDLKEALRLLRGACAQYPEEAALKSLLAQAEAALKERERREAAVRKGRDLITEGRFEEAVSLLEPMVKLAPADAEVSSLLARAREALALRRRQEAIEKLAKEALALAGDRSYDRALALVDSGLKTWTDEPQLAEVRASILAAQVAWQRAQALQTAIEQARSLGREKRYADALPHIAAALKEYKDDPTLLQLEKEYRLRQNAAQARRLIEEGRPGEALGLLEKCAREAASDPELNALIRKARADIRVAEIASQAKEARSLAAAEDFDGALALLEDGLRKWPDATALAELQQATLAEKTVWQRRTAVRNAVAKCDELEKSGQLEAAIERVNRFLEEFQNEPELLTVRQRLQVKAADQERRRKRKRDLEVLAGLERAAIAAAGSSETGELLAKARRITSEYPGDDEVTSAAAQPVRHLSDVERAAKEVQQRNFPAAIQICANYLARFPDHLLFGKFKREAELGQKLAYVEELQRRAAAETDLQKRAKILEEGLKRHPDEKTLANELRFTRNKLALVDSIVKKARAHEEEGLWDKALDEWNSLLTIYDQYPDLAAEIDRVDRARTKVLSEAVERWAKQVEQALEAGDTGRATSLLRQAQTEFPDAARLQDLALRVKEFAEKKKRARDLLAQAQAAFGKGKFEECRTSLRQAFQTDNNATLRKLVLSKLIEYAQAALQSDWRQAEQLAAEVQALQPGYAAPDSLLRTIADRKKDSAVSECLAKAEQLRKGGDVRGALAEVQGALQLYPNEASLNKLRDGLVAQIGKEREAVTAELRRIDQAIQAAAVAAELEPFRNRISAVAAANREDADLAAQAAATLRNLDLRTRQLKRAQIRGLISANRKGLLVGAATAGALFAGIVVVPRILRAPEEISVSVTTDVAGVSIAVGQRNCITPKDCVFKLAPGTYTLQAAKVGYKSLSRQFTVASKQSPPDLALALEPLPQLLQINTTFESGQVIVDNRVAGELRDGQFTVSGIAPGKHTVRVTGGGAEFQAEWRSVAGAAPELIRLVTAKDVQAAVVANAGPSGSIACNCESQDISVDGAPAGRTPASAGSPVALKDLKDGARQITLGARSLVVNVGANPALNVSLNLDRNVGVLTIETGQDKVKIFLNNQLYRRTTEHGTLRIPLNVGSYSIRVQKDGFQASAPQSIALTKGEEKPVRFTLTPVPAYLVISAAPPGTRVKVDNDMIGETDRNGGFRHEIAPGPHTIELTKDDYTTIHIAEQFNSGQTVPMGSGRVPVPKAAPPKGPSAPDPRQVEAQAWGLIVNSSNPDDFDGFIRNHPDSSRIDQARTRAAELRTQQQAIAARQAEQKAWEGVDPNRRDQLADFLSRYPSGAHAQQARNDIAEIDRKATEALNAQRQKELEAKRLADEQAIFGALKNLEGAYNNKDLELVGRLWSEAPAATLSQTFKEAKDLKFELQPSGPATINGNSASIVCTRVITYRAKGDNGPVQKRSQRVKVTLTREASMWLIRSIVVQ